MTDSMKRRIALVMLSAGASSRMGQPKQLLPWKNSTLLQHSLDQALQAKASEVILVLGANHERILAEIENRTVTLVINANWSDGMSASIGAAMKYLGESGKDFDGVLFCLSDQPLLDFNYYNDLIDKFLTSTEEIVYSKYSKSYGVPAIFPKTMFHELENLSGDKGAKSLIQRNLERAQWVDASSLAVDLDTMEQYRRFYLAYGQ